MLRLVDAIRRPATVRGTTRTTRHSEGATVTAVLTTPPITAAERCDRCGAQAYVRVLLATGGELLFCAHHGREHSARLREVAAEIHDQSDRLTAPAIAPDGER